MKIIKKNHLAYVLVLIIFLLIVLRPSAINSQGADFMMSWSADTYTDPSYMAKSLPTENSAVVAAVISLSQQNMADFKIQWYLDDKKQDSGLDEFSFKVSKKAGEQHSLKAIVKNSAGQEVAALTKSIKIVSPELILYLATSKKALLDKAELYRSSKTTLLAQPFFFSVVSPAELSFKWQSDNQEPIKRTGDDYPNTLIIEAQDYSKAFVTKLNIEAANNGQEAATQINLNFNL